MKRLINYIKNLFGADVRLRKWCIEQTSKDVVNNYTIESAEKLYNWVTYHKKPLLKDE